MEPPQAQAIETSTTYQEDEQDKVINDCCSCCFDCTETILDYLFCGFC
ncbi:hypothetical protein RchiOBHm_Chr2g0104841 [Rosa chinensis]|uniref:Uncharacterized protein n=1 Tax=Rosa chinensis TaxID=74649 RepID=A0A2P6RNA0_ROSCH|nr:hypothetical protein RchiOBHm_Chr2g0104841 [Rosa chinensis]